MSGGIPDIIRVAQITFEFVNHPLITDNRGFFSFRAWIWPLFPAWKTGLIWTPMSVLKTSYQRRVEIKAGPAQDFKRRTSQHPWWNSLQVLNHPPHCHNMDIVITTKESVSIPDEDSCSEIVWLDRYCATLLFVIPPNLSNAALSPEKRAGDHPIIIIPC